MLGTATVKCLEELLLMLVSPTFRRKFHIICCSNQVIRALKFHFLPQGKQEMMRQRLFIHFKDNRFSSWVFFFNSLFNWRKITLQCYVGFCCASIEIIHNYTYIPSLLDLPLLPPSHPSRSSQSTRLGSLCYTATSHQLSILYRHACMLSCFSHVRLCVTLWTVAHHAPLSTGFSRQEYWSGLPFPSLLLSCRCCCC